MIGTGLMSRRSVRSTGTVQNLSKHPQSCPGVDGWVAVGLRWSPTTALRKSGSLIAEHTLVMSFFKKIKSCTKVGKAIQGHPDGLHAPAGRPPRSPRALGHHPAASRAQRRPTGAQWHQDRRSDRDCMYRGRRSLLGLVIQPQDPVLVVSGVRADFGNPISKQWFSELCGATAGDIFRHPKDRRVVQVPGTGPGDG